MTTFVDAELDVRGKLTRGESFERIEHYIGCLPIAEDEKDRLWLLAWSELPRGLRRRIVLAVPARD